MIQTVLGAIEACQLGKTLMHEHMGLGFPGFEYDDKYGMNPFVEVLNECVQAARLMQSYGVNSYVDVTPADFGRNPELLAAVSVATGLQIICATGLYSEQWGTTAYYRLRDIELDVDICEEMAEQFTAECKEGIGNTGIKPGIIKVGTSFNEVTKAEQALLKAAAKTQELTDIPITTHTQGGTMGIEQGRILLEAGANPERCVIGHMCGDTDIEHHIELMKMGFFVGIDRLGQDAPGFPGDEQRIKMIRELIDRGYERQIILSHDKVTYWYGRERKYTPANAELMKKNTQVHIFTDIIPSLQQCGVDELTIERILTNNPRRVFGDESI